MSNTNTTMLHLRVDRQLLANVKKLAKSMGVSLSLVGETFLKDFLNTKRIIIDGDYVPNENLKQILDEAEKNRDKAEYWEEHTSVESLMKDLNN